MPSWNEIHNEIRQAGSTLDVIRRRYLQALHDLTQRNVIAYYSGWLQKPDTPGTQVNDADKNGFMNVIHELDRELGLDLILHTPGGETGATESLVDYLRAMFGTNIRVMVPQLAMSAGTLISCAAKTIIMGKHSSLGPIDPQFLGLPAHGVVEEFERAARETKADPSKAFVWQPIIAKYHPTLIGECEKAIKWSKEMAKEWLLSGMLHGQDDADQRADSILQELAVHAATLSHARHLSPSRCAEIGLDVTPLEDSDELQDALLSVHHAFIHTLSATAAYKIIENHRGVAFVQIARQVMIQQ